MISIAAECEPATGRAVRPVGSVVEVLGGLEAAEATWRAFEAVAVATPYGRLDWVRSFVAATGTADAVRVVAVRDEDGRLQALWPVAVSRRIGVAIASPIGGKHANFNLPLLRPGADLGRDPAALLRAIGRRLGVDVVAVPDMPAEWDGEPNPFAALARPGPNVAPQVRLEPDGEATARRSMSNEARKRLRNKERGLAKLGPVRFGRAETATEVDGLLDAFFRQKEARFRQLGIADPFAGPEVRRFVREAALGGLAERRPAIELYGLHVGETVAAVLGGAADGRRLSGMFISFEAWPDATKFSPGDILVSRIVQEQCRLGRVRFDLGTGEARYKRIFCDEEIRLLDLRFAVTVRGRALAAAAALLTEGKRRLKSSPQAMRLLARLRRTRPGAAASR